MRPGLGNQLHRINLPICSIIEYPLDLTKNKPVTVYTLSTGGPTPGFEDFTSLSIPDSLR
jgi:hypothetical protein